MNQKVKKKIDNLNEMFGWTIKEKFAKLDPTNAKEVEKLFRLAYAEILTNPVMGSVSNAADRTSTEKKYDLTKKFVDNNGGTLRTTKMGSELVYMPQSVKDKSTPSMFI